ncbi:MAG TPA: hypothetical protein VGL18_07265 [Actinomycetota bacterium]
MRDLEEGQTQARPGRCAAHPGAASVGVCDVCGRSLCVACAIPVRGAIVGRECLATVVKDAPPPEPIPSPIRPRGGKLALGGFALVMLVSLLPWSRFGDSSRYFGAWTPHWSLIAALAGVAGFILALFVTYRPLDPRIEAGAFGLLGVVVVIAAAIQHRHPPILSEATYWPWVAVLGGTLAILGAVLKVMAVLEARRTE